VRKDGSIGDGSGTIRVGLGLSEARGLVAGQDAGVGHPVVSSVGDRGSADDSCSSVLASDRLGDRNVLVLGADDC
jgi:hypothetical protein